MYKVLIAEDEILVRLGLANSIAWNKLGMELTAQAANGVQAYEIFLSERPDIVITDIRMPLMDGMELIQKIRETDTDCKIIIITCVEEFSYARQAIAYQVEDYILKLTMDMSEIEALLTKIRKSLDSERSQKQLSAPAASSSDLQAKRTIYDFLCGYSSSVPYNSRTVSFQSRKFYLAFIRILSKNTESQEESVSSKVCSDKSIYQILEQNLEHDGALLIERIPGEYFLLFCSMETFQKDFENVTTLMKNYYNSRPICGISPLISDFSEAAKAAQWAQNSLSQYFFSPEKYFFTTDAPENKSKIKESILTRVKEIILGFSDSYPLITGFWEEYAERMERFLSDCSGDCNEIRKLFYYLADWLQESLELSTNKSADNCVYNYHRYIFEATNILDIYYIFERLLNKLLSFTHSADSLSRETLEIMRYIENHYAENLSLEALAAQVNYSKSHLYNVFRKELNTSFGNYLTKVRILHAKKLLTTSFLRLYEIAERTGFYDYSHFARTFKKYTGVSPQEYQNHQAANMQEELTR